MDYHCINIPVAVWFIIDTFCCWLFVDSLSSSLLLLYQWLADGRSFLMWHSSWAGPCFSVTLQIVPDLRVFGEDEQLLSFLGRTGTAAQRPFVPSLFRCCGLVIVYFSLLCLFYRCLCFFHPSVSPRLAQHLLSYLLFDSWHAERCQPIPVTHCCLYFWKTGKTFSFHSAPRILSSSAFCFSLSVPEYGALSRIVVLLMCTCSVKRFINESFLCQAFNYASPLLMTNPFYLYFPLFFVS